MRSIRTLVFKYAFRTMYAHKHKILAPRCTQRHISEGLCWRYTLVSCFLLYYVCFKQKECHPYEWGNFQHVHISSVCLALFGNHLHPHTPMCSARCMHAMAWATEARRVNVRTGCAWPPVHTRDKLHSYFANAWFEIAPYTILCKIIVWNRFPLCSLNPWDGHSVRHALVKESSRLWGV